MMDDAMHDRTPLLTVSDLHIAIGDRTLVDGVSLAVARGGATGLVGESGSGKSLTLRSLIGLTPPTMSISGEMHIGDRVIDLADRAALARLRGSAIGMIFQEPAIALNPLMRVWHQVTDAAAARFDWSARVARAEACALLAAVGIADPERCADARPFELSGGMRQRVMIAAAIAGKPQLLLCDEPTTALDVTVQAQVLQVLGDLRVQLGTALLYVSHDLAVVNQMCERISVMREGVVVEEGAREQVLLAPQHPYTQRLLDATPRLDGAFPPARDIAVDPLIELSDAVVEFGRGRHRNRVLQGVPLRVERGEVVALVGESGSGKSTIARVIAGLQPLTSGALRIAGEPAPRRITRRSSRRVQMVFQDPHASLDPTQTIGGAIAEVLRAHRIATGSDLRARQSELLEMCQLDDSFLARYPDELSGGQRQRVAIARAIALQPELLIADEATAALDVSVQAEILQLLATLRSSMGIAILLITHDLAVVRELSDRVVVLRRGEIMEQGITREVFNDPQSPYTRELLASVPELPRRIQDSRGDLNSRKARTRS